MPCPGPSPSNPKRASHPFSAHRNSPSSLHAASLSNQCQSFLRLVVLSILLVQQGFFASYRVSFIDLAIMQDEKAEDCPEYPVFALFIVLGSYLPHL